MISALNRSLYLKQSIATFVLAVILSVVLSFFQAYQTLREEPDRIYKEFNDVLSLVERPMAQALFRLDRVFAQQQAESLLFHPAIVKVVVEDESGEAFAEAKATPIDSSISTSMAKWLLPDDLTVTRALNYTGMDVQLGKIALHLDRRYLVSQVIRFNSQLFIQNLVKDILLASLLSLLFYLMVTRPLKQLTWSLTRVDKNAQVNVPNSFDFVHSSDELGRLKLTFSKLLSRLTTALDALDRSHQHSKAMISHAADGILVVNKNLKTVVANEAAERLTGLTVSQLTHTPLNKLHDDNLWLSLDELIQEMPINGVMTVETSFSPEKDPIPVEIRITKYLVQGDPETVLLIRDLSERKEAQQRINRLAFYDSLTRLPNRSLLVDRLRKAMDNIESDSVGALIMLDLDRFKTINDSLGHNVGDQLLVKVVDSLMPLMPSNATFARMGGDEFVLLWDKVKNTSNDYSASVTNFVQRVLRECSKVKHVEEHELHVTASIGISFFDGSEESPATVLRQADTALYKAKEIGRNTFSFFQEDMQAMSDARLHMEKALHRALKEREFEVYYQPQNNKDGHIIGAEALLRWRDPERGFIPPMEFIPIAEDIGLIHEIGRYVFNAAAAQVSLWREQGIWQDDWRMSINVSPMQFSHPHLLAGIKEALERNHLPASAVDIEITENMLMSDLELALSKMAQIRELGITLSIDDFGTGYSSLKYLKDLPIDRLKIDQSFVRDLISDRDDRAIVVAIIAMAKALEVNVLAEGVESRALYEQLQELGCYTYQGYFFGRPVPKDEFVALCKAANIVR